MTQPIVPVPTQDKEYPISANFRDGFSKVPLTAEQVKSAMAWRNDMLTAMGNVTVGNSKVTYGANAFKTLSPQGAYGLVSLANRMARLCAVKDGMATLIQATPAKAPALATAAAAPATAQLIVTHPGGARGPNIAQCDTVLQTVQYWNGATASELSAMQTVVTQINGLLAQAQLAATQASGVQATQAQWNNLQALCQQLQILFKQLGPSGYSGLVAEFARITANSAAGVDTRCPNITAINNGVAQAQQDVTVANNIANDPNLEWDSFVVAAYLDIPEPPPSPVAQPVVSFNPTVTVRKFFQDVVSARADVSPKSLSIGINFDPPVEVILTINESDTQSLIAFLKSNVGSSIASTVATAIAGIAVSAIVAATGVGAPLSAAAIAGTVLKTALTVLAIEIEEVMVEADTNKKGVSFHFSLLPTVIAAAGYEVGAATIEAAILEGNLIQEMNTPGGIGSPWLDMFWIKGN